MNNIASDVITGLEQYGALIHGCGTSGQDALGRGLIDAIGGVSRAVAIAKQAADLGAPDDDL